MSSSIHFNSYEDLQIVVLDKPMYFMHEPFVRDVLSKVIRLKIDSYETIRSNYFAFDYTDLMATHFLAGTITNDEFEPLIGIKCISMNECESRKIHFSAESVAENTNSQIHIKAVNNFITTSLREVEDIGYIGSLALEPRITDKIQRIALLEVFESMVARYCYFQKIKHCICIGRVKTDAPKVISRIGYEKIAYNNVELPPVICPLYANEEFYFMTLKNLSDETLILAEKYRNHWEDKIIFSDNVFDYAQLSKHIQYHHDEQKKAS